MHLITVLFLILYLENIRWKFSWDIVLLPLELNTGYLLSLFFVLSFRYLDPALGSSDGVSDLVSLKTKIVLLVKLLFVSVSCFSCWGNSE